MARYVFDLEANDLYEKVTKLHCLVLEDLDTDEIHKFRPSEVEQGLRMLMEADLVIGHNIINYDIPAIAKIFPWFKIARAKVIDTLVLSRLFYPNMADKDRTTTSRVTGKLVGSHSLKAWGLRLNFPKGDFDEGFEVFTENMLTYNVQDVAVTRKLYELILRKFPQEDFRKSIDLEHAVAFICSQQVRNGFEFNEAAAMKLNAELLIVRSKLEDDLTTTFKPFYLPAGEVTPKRTMRRKGVTYEAGAPYTKVKLTVFNPGSRHHIASRLKSLHGWEPTVFTPSGDAKIDETVLVELPYPEAKLLARYFLIQKRIGMLSEGDNAWLNFVRNGRIHGDIITNGAVTGRATHRSPNLAQVPSVGSPYGKECRTLFTVRKGKKLVGIDVSGLELRMLGHFIAKYDNGAYGEIVVNGDVHSANASALFGLQLEEFLKGRKDKRLLIEVANSIPGSGVFLQGLNPGERKTVEVYKYFEYLRGIAKTFIYAFLYGAGSGKIGSIMGKGSREGSQLKAKFLKGLPALGKLIDAVASAAKRGYLVGIDGRHLHVRSEHSALNVLLQSAGALVCKRWLVEMDVEIAARGWTDKVKQVVWVHDEVQCEVDEDIAEAFGQMAIECIVRAGAYFNIRVPLTGEYKIGNDWAETH